MSRAWTWRHAILKSYLPATTKHVLLVISCHMNEVGEGCYPSTVTLAERCSLSERSVCTHIEAAEKLGWLTVKPHGFGGQNWARNEYAPAWPKGTEPGAEIPEGTEPRDTKALNLTTEGTEPGAAYIDNIPDNIPINSPRRAKGEHPGFEEFWNAYPRKVGKPTALKVWLKLQPGLGAVLQGVASWKASRDWRNDGGKFIPHPTTFLNQRRWEDSPEPERAVNPHAPLPGEPVPF